MFLSLSLFLSLSVSLPLPSTLHKIQWENILKWELTKTKQNTKNKDAHLMSQLYLFWHHRSKRWMSVLLHTSREEFSGLSLSLSWCGWFWNQIFFSCGFGSSRVISNKKFSILLNCPFPVPLARENNICWNCLKILFYLNPLAFLGYQLLQLQVWDERG